MTSKIAIAVIAVLVTVITAPTAYAALNPTDETFDKVLQDINTLFEKTDQNSEDIRSLTNANKGIKDFYQN